MLLFWVLVIYLIVWLVRKAPTTTGTKNSSLDILKERYAKGEINKEQFEGMKKDLQ